MNKMNKFFLMGTMALSGMAGLTACSSDDDVNGNGNDGAVENGVVKTQFALNVPYASNGTRMTEGATQGNGQTSTFRGISDIRLLSFNTTPAAGVTSTTNISLGTDKDAMEQDNYRRIYRDITIPLGTNHFVFYGTATGTEPSNSTESTASQKWFQYGSLKASEDLTKKPGTTGNAGEQLAKTATELNDINFSLVAVEGQSDLALASKGIADALTELAKMSWNGETWKSLAGMTQATTKEEVRKKHAGVLYTKFTSLTAGSKTSVLATLTELKNAIGVKDQDYATPSEFLEELMNATRKAYNDVNAVDDVTEKLGLPDGVARLKFAGDAFSYVNPNVINETDNNLDYTKVCYPASLNYFVSTTLKATDDVLTGFDGWPSYSNWTKKDGTTGEVTPDWTNTGHIWGNEVTAATRSIGLEMPIQYGVANLKTQVKIADSKTVLEDNAQANGEINNRNVPINNGTTQSFKLVGIVVGGQPAKVGWNYEPLSTEDFKTAIYDNVMNTTKDTEGHDIPLYLYNNTYTNPNYTLVLDNKNNGTGVGAGQADVVYVTLELVNNSGMEFFGKDGIVPKDGKFYLVGKLDVSTANNTTGNTANKNGQDHIFVQDHTTFAKFTISSLKSAYNVIPDLRASSISLGLAVDLEWQNGMEFDYTIGD